MQVTQTKERARLGQTAWLLWLWLLLLIIVRSEIFFRSFSWVKCVFLFHVQ